MKPPAADRVAAVSAAAAAAVPSVIEWTKRIAAVPAPTGDEGERSAFVRSLFAEAGLQPRVDDLGDVVVTLPGRRRGSEAPAVLLAAHLDTVFARGTPLPIAVAGSRMHGPGVGDNSVGVAAVLAIPSVLRAAAETPPVDILLTGNVGEEGLGNLRGIRAVMDAHPRIGAVVAVEGHNLGRVTHVAVGSKRLRITATGPGGHSWGDFGRPSALHALAKLIADLDAITLPWSPKTTLNVGVVEGGISVNSIAPTASCLVDLRSVEAASLARLAEKVDRVVDGAGRDGVSFAVETLGERPAGEAPLDSDVVRVATVVLGALGVETAYDASSTDANVALARGVPAVCIGLTSGGNVHREDEYIETEPLATGLAQLALLALELGDRLADGTLRRA
ncbi:MAG: M20/M25/M40 family metallo-hydrolase [Chloroflexia bacterium]|nr:M20/M25/M40 family metallo-hydrolase [Chloroflexia bacterium]